MSYRNLRVSDFIRALNEALVKEDKKAEDVSIWYDADVTGVEFDFEGNEMQIVFTFENKRIIRDE